MIQGTAANAGRVSRSPVAGDAFGDSNLTESQLLMWIEQKLYPRAPLYNVAMTFTIEGALNHSRMQEAFARIVAESDALRTVIEEVQGNPQQRVLPYVPFDVDFVDFTTDGATEDTLEVWLAARCRRPFELDKRLFDAALIKLASERFVWYQCQHHLISDGWSTALIYRRLMTMYERLDGGDVAAAQSWASFQDYVASERTLRKSPEYKRAEQYWREKLAEPLVPVTFYGNAPSEKGLQKERVVVDLGLERSRKLMAIARQEDIFFKTPNVTLLNIFNTLLFSYLDRITGNRCLAIGSVFHGRATEVMKETIGPLMRVFPLKVDLDEGETFLSLLGKVKQEAADSLRYASKVVSAGNENANAVTMNFYNMEYEDFCGWPTRSEIVHTGYGFGAARSDLDILVRPSGCSQRAEEDSLLFYFDFNRDVFNEAQRERAVAHFMRLMDGFIADYTQPIAGVDLLAQEERALLQTWSVKKATFEQGVCVHELFERQAEKTPEAIAVAYGKQHLTYGALNRRANQLAHHLQSLGVGPETLVAVCFQRSLEMVVALLGVLKAGGAYVPLDPEYPTERLAFMLEDTQAPVLLTQQNLLAQFPQHGAEVICLDTGWMPISQQVDETNPDSGVDAENLAYIVYTSGSTGKPKGVMIEHRSLVNHNLAIVDHYDLKSTDRVLQFASMSFDVAVEEIFPTLLSGATLILSPERHLAIDEFLTLVESEALTVLNLPTPYWHKWVDALSDSDASLPGNLRLVVIGSDKASAERCMRWQKIVGDQVRWCNAYGPTEATITATIYDGEGTPAKDLHSVPIGRPVTNTQVYVLDNHLQPVPIGVPGEICVGGMGLARGYLNRPMLTDEKFIRDPFDSDASWKAQSSRLYRTGDRARWLPDGNLEFLGRVDDQTKIRGFRIEPGEIEAVLDQHPLVGDAVVIVREVQSDQKQLVSYIVPQYGDEYIALWPSPGDYQIWDESMYHAMTHDELRVARYRDAIDQSVAGKTVVDIGTGKDLVLTRLCLEAGAKHVYAIEANANAYEQAKRFIENNDLQDKVTLLYGDSTAIEMPEQVEVCVSELIGTIGGSEGVVPILNDAQKFLKPDGLMIPQQCITRIAAITLPDAFLESPGFATIAVDYVRKIFDRVGHKFDLRVCIDNFPKENIISDVGIFEDLDFTTTIDLAYERDLTLTIERDSRLDGFLLWLNLNTIEGVVIDNLADRYNWLPVFFPVFSDVQVRAGDVIEATCSGWLSEDNANPNYRIHGRLVRNSGEIVEFDHAALLYGEAFKSTAFYDRLFEGEEIKTRSDWRSELTVPDLKKYLEEHLPAYMVPSYFQFVEDLPLTPSGKVDRKALPAPDMSALSREQAYVAPRTPVEELLAEILAEVLKLERAGIEDNFFDLGGHSLLAMQVISRVRQAFGVELPLRSMFESPTVAELAGKVDKRLRFDEVKESPEIRHVARDEALPLSFAQERIWFVDRLQPESSVFHSPMAVKGKGWLDVELLRQCFNELVARHEALRTTVETVNGRPVQRIVTEMVLDLPVIDLRSLSESEREARLQQSLIKQAREPFDLARGPLLRALLFWLPDEESIVFVNMHHIISDDWSTNLFWQELSALYRAATTGEAYSLPELPIQFADYAAWQRSYYQGEVLEDQVSYWRERLAGVPALNLPTDYPRPVVQRYEGAMASLPLEDTLFHRARQLSRDESATPYITLLAAYFALLYRYTGQDDIAIGTAIANRRWLESESLMGALINMLVLRNTLSGDLPFRELLCRTREIVLEAYVHQDVPFETLVEELQPERSTTHSPLFQVGFNYNNMPNIVLADGQEWENIVVDRGAAQFDLTLTVKDFGQRAAIELEYSTALFSEETAQRMLEHYVTLLEGAVYEPDHPLFELPVLTSNDWEQIGQWNESTSELEHDILLHERFEAQVEESPDAVAVVFGDEQLTYRELNQRANCVAHYLQALGVQPETLVGICVERSMEMIVGILGVLKAGGAYVPLDPKYPQDRLAFMLADTQAPVLLTQAGLLAHLPEHNAHSTVCLDSDWQRIVQESSENPVSGVTSGNLAYVIYTSGSTGKPKGVLVEHRGIGNLARSQREALDLNENSRVLQFASFSFDGMVWELLALLAGATLVVATQSDLMPGPPLVNLLRDQAITMATLPPSALSAMPAEQFPDLKTVVSAGEACSADVVTRWSPGRRFFNGYGPTESTVCATLAECEEGDGTPPIGRPIANIQVHILDKHLNPVPIGVPGELCIGGIGLARGYLNRPELTAERFVFHEGFDTRLYRTGDLGRYLPDGNIEYLGRLDDQVQLRGYRIELGEIEAVLSRYPGVRQSVATVREDNPGDKRLVAYVVADGDNAFTPQELRAAVREVLPDYMVPSAFVLLDELPLTPNKKVDRKALPAPAQTRPELEEAFVAPGSSLEETLVAIWCEVLGIERVGVHDNFFDLGGHSLLVAEVHDKVQKALGLKELPLVKLFQYATVRTLAQYLSNQTDELPSRQVIRDRAAQQKAALARQRQRRIVLDSRGNTDG